MRTAYRAGVVMRFVLALCGTGVRADQATPCAGTNVGANIEASPEFVRMMQRLSNRSPTFKTQCDRIAAAPHLRVRIQVEPQMPNYCRAFTEIRRVGRQLRADVHLPPAADHSELIAHEFEHLIEQLDGLDLRQLSRVRGSGVREIERELFESDRAVAAGRLAASEARRASPAAD